MLAIDGNQVQVELGSSLSLGVLEDDLQVGGFLVCLESDLVAVVSELHDFSQISDRDSDNHVGVSTVVVEALHGQVEGHEGNMGGVHGLE